MQQGYRALYREAHTFLKELAEATLAETRKDYLAELTLVPLLVIDDTAIVRGVGVERCARRSTKAGARTPATRRIRC